MATALHFPTPSVDRDPGAASWPGLAAGVLDLLREATFVISDAAVLLGGNRAAERLLRNGTGLSRAGARIVALNGSATLALHDGIARAAGGEIVHLRFAQLGRAPLLLRIEPYPRPAAPAVCERAVVAFAWEQDARRPGAEELTARFGFTPTEGSIAARMSAGLTPERIAEEFGVKLSTVRGHLKHIFEKTRTHRQAELVAKLFSEG